MIKHKFSATFLVCALLLPGAVTFAADSQVPEPFRGFDPASNYRITYADLDSMLKIVVVDTGRSTREKAEPTQAKTGTRMKANVKRSTINEGNRVYYELFRDDENAAQVMLEIQKILENLPSEAPLAYFSRQEQLAYWLNLYNVTVINEIVKIYPQRKLKKYLSGKKSILSPKILEVAGVPLSLDDIQHTILKQNYDNDPLVMYGLYQGNIGGPNIRKSSYTGTNVYRYLKDNAAEFVNSNRGTYAKDEKIFRASSLYDRNRDYFQDFQADLKKHLLGYLQGRERKELEVSSTIKPDISDWTITDLFGSYPQIGGSLAENKAALLDATKTTTTSDGSGSVAGPAYSNALRVMAKTPTRSYVSPELIVYLQELKTKQDMSNLDKATVTVEELGEVPVEPGPDSSSEPDGGEND